VGTVWNIRGTNGSGKSTLARAFLPPNPRGDAEGGPVDLAWYAAPTKRDPVRRKRSEGTVRKFDGIGLVGLIGRYDTACGGMDALPSFDVQQRSIAEMLSSPTLHADHVLAEGILASTVYGSWADFARACRENEHRFAFVYMHTPLDVCLRRIKARQAAAGREREIKEDLVRDKFAAIMRTRDKAVADGQLVYDLPHDPTEGGREAQALAMMMKGEGEVYRVQP
jgi:predicted ABC-type ATPase